jgi:chromosome segregation ATPase
MEKRSLAEINEKASRAEGKIREARKKSGGVNAAHESNVQMQKQIKILENRLEKCYHKFNEAITKNKELREQINNLRRERLVFDGIYKKLEKELQDKKKDMARIIDVCNIAYESRDAASPPTLQTCDRCALMHAP